MGAKTATHLERAVRVRDVVADGSSDSVGTGLGDDIVVAESIVQSAYRLDWRPGRPQEAEEQLVAALVCIPLLR